MNIVKIILPNLFIVISLLLPSLNYGFTLLINPAGDAQYAGRAIDDHFERGLTLQFAKAIQNQLLTHNPDHTVIINTIPDTRSAFLHTAQVANRIQPDIALTIHFYQETMPKPSVYLYHFSFGDHFFPPSNQLQLLPYDQAHRINYNTTEKWAQYIHTQLSNYPYLFKVPAIHALPCKELNGIIAPALLLEIGLKHKDDWLYFVDPLVASLLSLFSTSV